MSIFKIKKIISFSLLTLFLFSLFLPINASATGGWYFANNPLFTNANAFVSPSGYTNEKLCNDALTVKISEDFLNNLKNINYSKCILLNKNNAKTSDVIAKDPLPWKTVQELYVVPSALASLVVNATKLNLGINESSTITVTTSPKKSEVKIDFSLSNNNGSLDKTTCTTDTSGSCNVSFTALKNGAYGIGCYTTSHPEYKNCSSIAGTISVTAFTAFTSTTSEEAKTKENYYPLATLPGVRETCTPSCDAEGNCKTTCVKLAPDCSKDPKNCTPGLGFAGYLNILIEIFIGICAILAMIMIVFGGIQYMTSGLVSSKQAAKDTIQNAILGLLLALGAFAILNTINPDLVGIGLQNLPTATISAKDLGFTLNPPGGTSMDISSTGLVCPHSGGSAEIPAIVESMRGKVTYRWGGAGQSPPFINPWVQENSPVPTYTNTQNTNCPTGTVCLDCTGFTYFVFKCAGLNLQPYPGTVFHGDYGQNGLEKINSLEKSGNDVMVNGKKLNPGDILGMPTKYAKALGHVVGHAWIYYGNNMAAESGADEGWPAGAAMKTFPVVGGKYQSITLGVYRSGSSATTSGTGTTGGETLSSITFNKTTKKLKIVIGGTFITKNEHKAYINWVNPNGASINLTAIILTGASQEYGITEYSTLQPYLPQTVSINVKSAGISIGKESVEINK